MINLWNTIFYEPLYNGLIFLISVVPGGSVALSVIVLTLIVKFILYPLSQKSIDTQVKMRSIEGEVSAIKEKNKDKEVVARETMALYKKNNINPFSGCLTVLIQLPIIIALYFVFLKGLTPENSVLYSFVNFPEHINIVFWGLIDVTKKSLALGIVAGIAQYFQTALTMPKPKTSAVSGKISFADEFSRSMYVQMKYFLPILIVFIAYTTSAAVALYWITSSVFMIGQEYVVRKKAGIDFPMSNIWR